MQFALSAQAAPDAAPLYVFSDAARFANGDAAAEQHGWLCLAHSRWGKKTASPKRKSPFQAA